MLQGDRSHVYDQLVDRGMTVGVSTLVGIGLQVTLTAIGLAATQVTPAIALAITAATALALAGIAVSAGLLGSTRR